MSHASVTSKKEEGRGVEERDLGVGSDAIGLLDASVA